MTTHTTNLQKLICSCILVLLAFSSAKACDICGCGIGSYYTGILPEFNKHILGIRYRYSSLQTHLGQGGVSSYLTTNERFHTVDVWGGWTLNPKVRIMGYVPVSFNEKTNQGNTTNRSGIGDIGMQAFYNLFDQRNSVGKNLVLHSLWLGAGIKLPTGNYDPAQKDDSQQSANTFQLGTGTVDFSANMMYDLRIRDFGINTTAIYKVNTTNKEQYQYGNKFSSTLQAYYKVRVKNKFTVAPNVGLAYETASRDRDDRFIVDASGGNIVSQTSGLEITTNKIALGGSWQMPVHQQLANGSVKAGNRLMVHISFML